MRRVSVSLEAARYARDVLKSKNGTFLADTCNRIAREFTQAIERAERTAEAKRRLAKPKQERKAKKREETSAIREAVMKRADGQCELCRAYFTQEFRAELHHALGRGRAKQAESNCLGVCSFCHHNITVAKDGAASLRAQAAVFERLQHYDTAKRLKWRADFVLSRASLQAMGRATP